MAGYWQRPDETAKVMTPDGFFKTGDVGMMDERASSKSSTARRTWSGQRLQRLSQRTGRRGGQMPGVMECAVVGVIDAKTGEAVKLVIVKKDPH
jgi:long-chain acyl-CoA synthetase